MSVVNILFFATLKEQAGVSQAELELPSGADVAALKRALYAKFPQLPQQRSAMLVAVNHEYAFDGDPVPEGAEVALFPPVSGGAADRPTVLAVMQDALDLDALLARITLPATGAACVFTGVVRGVTEREARQTQRLVYEAYQPMAEAKLQQVADEIRQRWPDVQGIAIVQRVGELLPGTPTVLIACSAAHRDTGVFEAARYGIDRLKEIVPIWKKEIGPAGEEWIEGEYIPAEGD